MPEENFASREQYESFRDALFSVERWNSDSKSYIGKSNGWVIYVGPFEDKILAARAIYEKDNILLELSDNLATHLLMSIIQSGGGKLTMNNPPSTTKAS